MIEMERGLKKNENRMNQLLDALEDFKEEKKFRMKDNRLVKR